MELVNLVGILLVVAGYGVKCETVYLNLNSPTPDEISFMKRYGYLPESLGGMEYSFTPQSVSEAVAKMLAFAGLPPTGSLDVETRLITFMKRYGYLPETLGGMEYSFTPQSVSEAVAKMQAFAGLPPTGTLDDETRRLFTKRRCGVKDLEAEGVSSRSRRYIVSQGWTKKDITYRVLNGSSTLPKHRIEQIMAAALAVWAPHGGLYFNPVDEGPADIQVSFVREDHGDGFPFDGPGRVVAHAFPPPLGTMHFDDDEVWGGNPQEDSEEVTDFFAVVVHEIGHALGLSHSDDKASVMYPYYKTPVERLHADDISGMRKLYYTDQSPDQGSPDTESPVVPGFTKADSEEEEDEEDIPDLCYTNYDTIQVIQGKIFVFEEEWVWVLSEMKRVDPGYPKRFHQVFSGLPEHVTIVRAIYERQNGNIVIFSGREYWEFDPSFRLVKRGNLGRYGIPRGVAELTTVFLSNFNNKTYLIEYERFWRFDEQTNRMDSGYPKDMSAWRQLPYPVDSAVIWKGDTYFFRGPRFWRFDNAQVVAHPYYPVPTAQVWFPCADSPDMERYVSNDGP